MFDLAKYTGIPSGHFKMEKFWKTKSLTLPFSVFLAVRPHLPHNSEFLSESYPLFL